MMYDGCFLVSIQLWDFGTKYIIDSFKKIIYVLLCHKFFLYILVAFVFVGDLELL